MTKKGYSFGTFQGVFVPTILTILGVIMYMRFGWLLGNNGLTLTFIIVTLATLVTFTTTLSLSSLATNSPVGIGGAYYIISRSLGIDAGAAIGIMLYCAQGLSVSFYVRGFAESLLFIFPQYNVEIVAVITIFVILLIVLYSADIALKSQYVILFLIIISLVSFFMGNSDKLPPVIAGPHDTSIISFWGSFAIFFPAVTGITAGLGMSGDLKNPARSITIGTLSAVIISYIVYMTIPVFLNNIVPDRYALLSNFLIMADVARWKWAVIAGLWGATLSSAVGCMLTAPRTMQALSIDRIFPRFLGKGSKSNNDPRIAVVITFLIALGGVLLGNLNVIAPILTMFFLATYGLINISATLESIIGSPWWRPSFKVHWSISLIGALLSFMTMFMIDAGAAFIAIIFSIVLYLLTKRRRLKATWGDMRSGLLMWIIQVIVHKLAGEPKAERTWRPNILVFAGSPSSKFYLISVGDALTRDRGIMTTVSILPDNTDITRIKSLSGTFRSFLDDLTIESLVKIHPSPSVSVGAQHLIESYGFGPILPNTILIGDPSENKPIDGYMDIIYCAVKWKKNIIVVKEAAQTLIEAKTPSEDKRLDVWWDQKSGNAGLILTIAFLMRSSKKWLKDKMTIHVITKNSSEESGTRVRINETVKRMRIKSDLMIHNNTENIDEFDLITNISADADFVIIGLKSPGENYDDESYEKHFYSVIHKIRHLPATALVMAREDIEFSELFI